MEGGEDRFPSEKLEELMGGADLDVSHARYLGREAGGLAALG